MPRNQFEQQSVPAADQATIENLEIETQQGLKGASEISQEAEALEKQGAGVEGREEGAENKVGEADQERKNEAGGLRKKKKRRRKKPQIRRCERTSLRK